MYFLHSVESNIDFAVLRVKGNLKILRAVKMLWDSFNVQCLFLTFPLSMV